MSETISRQEFEERLLALCIGGGPGMPRRHRDQQILLASATLWMEIGAVYSDKEVDQALGTWLDTVSPGLRLDEVTIRRELVDRSYLLRDDSGSAYSIGPGPADVQFEPDVGSIDPEALIAGAKAERERRRREYVADV